MACPWPKHLSEPDRCPAMNPSFACLRHLAFCRFTTWLWTAMVPVSLAAGSFPASYDLGRPAGSASDAPAVWATGRAAGDGLGRVVRSGDLNGDGFTDLIVGSATADVGTPARLDAGCVWVWLGRADWVPNLDAAALDGQGADVTVAGAGALDQLTNGGALTVADINGDGLDDLILGASGGDGPGNGRNGAGEAYVVLGRASFPAALDLAIAGAGGADVTLHGATAGDGLTTGGGLAAGDVNGDGLADLLIGAPLADGPLEAVSSCGEVYVVLGRSSFPATLDLGLAGDGGADVTLHGNQASDFLGLGGAVAVGDLNGDGLGDVIVGAQGGDGPAELRSNAGEACVFFGRPAWMAKAAAGTADVVIHGASAQDQLTSTGGLVMGDFNGDGLADLALSATGGDGPGETRLAAGEAYLILGRPQFPAQLDLAQAGAAGASLTLFGATASDGLTSGRAVLLADLNRDGRADLVLGAGLADGPGEARLSAGEVYVVLGRSAVPESLDLALSGAGGADTVIYGAQAGDNLSLGGAMAAGDVNGDGFADLLLGAHLADGPAEARTNAGEASLLLGRHRWPSVRDLSAPAGAEVTLFGATAGDQWTTGGALAIADLNGDGLGDMLLGAVNGDGPLEARSNAGELAVVFGLPTPEVDVLVAGTELADDGVQAMGEVGLAMTRSLSFTVRNSGSAQVSGLAVTLDGPDAGLFAVVAGPAPVLAPGASTQFTVRVSPTALGSWTAQLRLTSNDDDESPYDLTLTATAVPPVAPWVEVLEATGVSTTAATLQGAVNALGSLRRVSFDYGLTPAYGQTVTAVPEAVDGWEALPVSASLTGLQPRTFYHYRVRAEGHLGAAVSQDRVFYTDNRAPVAVADRWVVLPGAAVLLDVLANDHDPDGDTLRLAGFEKLLPANGGTLEPQGNRLRFTAKAGFTGASFSYRVEDGFGGEATAQVELVRGECGLLPLARTVPAAGATYEIAIRSNGAWAVEHRLPWVSVTPMAGTGDGIVQVTVQAQTLPAPRAGRLWIGGQEHALQQAGARPAAATPGWLQASRAWTGFLERHPGLNQNLGARLDLVLGQGVFSGKITSGAGVWPLAGHWQEVASDPAQVVLISPRSGRAAPWTLTLVAGAVPGTATGGLADGTGQTAALTAWGNVWETAPESAPLRSVLARCLFHPLSADPALPQGPGTAVVAAERGAEVWTCGRLADGSNFTSGSLLGPVGQFLLYQAFEGSRGSLTGVLQLRPASSPADPAPPAIDGQPVWFRAPVAGKGQAWADGFGPLPLQVEVLAEP